MPQRGRPSRGTGTLPACGGERKEFSSSPVRAAALSRAGMQPQLWPFVTRDQAAAQPQLEERIQNMQCWPKSSFSSGGLSRGAMRRGIDILTGNIYIYIYIYIYT